MRHYVKEQFEDGPVREITKKNIKKDNMREEPYRISLNPSGIQHGRDNPGYVWYYAACPLCRNPIQLIGLHKPLKNGVQPFGKHCDKPVDGFKYFNPRKYKTCPYYSLKKTRAKPTRPSETPYEALVILQMVRNNFFNLIEIVQNLFGFSISVKLAGEMLSEYIKEGPTEDIANYKNIPLMFVYAVDNTNLFKQKILDPAMLSAIKKHVSNAHFSENNRIDANPDKRFYEILFRSPAHNYCSAGQEIYEELTFELFEVGKKPFFRKVIQYHHTEQDKLFVAVPRNERSRALTLMAHNTINGAFPSLDERVAAGPDSEDFPS